MNKKVRLWTTVWLLIVATILILIYIGGGFSNRTRSDITDVQIRDNDWIRGDKNAKVVLLEYSDFQCPACEVFYSIVKQLEEKFGEDLAVVYRHFPLFSKHFNAVITAKAAEAAGQQGKFWEMHDLLFENQGIWSKESNPENILTGYAKDLGLNEQKFKEDLNSKEIEDKVMASFNEAMSMKLTGTPTFFLNGKYINNPRSYSDFEKLISETLSQ